MQIEFDWTIPEFYLFGSDFYLYARIILGLFGVVSMVAFYVRRMNQEYYDPDEEGHLDDGAPTLNIDALVGSSEFTYTPEELASLSGLAQSVAMLSEDEKISDLSGDDVYDDDLDEVSDDSDDQDKEDNVATEDEERLQTLLAAGEGGVRQRGPRANRPAPAAKPPPPPSAASSSAEQQPVESKKDM